MPKVPVIESQQVAPEPLGLPGINVQTTAAAQGGAIGQGLSQLGQAVFQRGLEMKQEDDEAKATERLNQFEQSVNETLLTGDDAFFDNKLETANERFDEYQQRLDESRNDLGSTLTRDQKQLFDSVAKRLTSSELSRMSVHAAGERRKGLDQKDKARIENTLESARLRSDDIRALFVSKATIADSLQSQAQRNGWSDDRLQFELNKVNLQFRESVFKAALNNDPAGVISELGGGGDRMSTRMKMAIGVTEEERPAFLQTAVNEHVSRLRSRNAEAEIIRKQQDRIQSDVEEGTAKDLDEKLASSDLTLEMVIQEKDNLSQGDFRYYINKLTSPSSIKTDANVYVDLFERAGNGEDIRGEARHFLTKTPDLRQGDYEKIIKRFESAQSKTPEFVKEAERFLRTSLGVNELNSDPFARLRLSNGVREFSNWVSDHPKATADEVQKESESIVKRAMIGNLGEFLLGQVAPRFLVGERTKPDIKATWIKTKKAFERGQIDKAELAREASKIESMSRSLKILSGIE